MKPAARGYKRKPSLLTLQNNRNPPPFNTLCGCAPKCAARVAKSRCPSAASNQRETILFGGPTLLDRWGGGGLPASGMWYGMVGWAAVGTYTVTFIHLCPSNQFNSFHASISLGRHVKALCPRTHPTWQQQCSDTPAWIGCLNHWSWEYVPKSANLTLTQSQIRPSGVSMYPFVFQSLIGEIVLGLERDTTSARE